jgi:hypothetical protein
MTLVIQLDAFNKYLYQELIHKNHEEIIVALRCFRELGM